jgi:hypothetical protein
LTTVCLALCASAQAQVVVGQTASAANPPVDCTYGEPGDEIQIGVAAGPGYVIPTTGAITAWSTFASGVTGQSMTLKVFRKVAPFSYLVVAQDTRPLALSVLNTFPAAIPVHAGDVIGEGEPGGEAPTPCEFLTGSSDDAYLYTEGSTVPPGGTVVFPGLLESGGRLNISATVLPPPTVASISPAEGSVKGAGVTISGANFASVTGVSFGAVPATSFTVVSEGQISAVAPVSKSLAPVPVSVTTAAGTAAAATPFTYQGCAVPGLSGKKLKAAKKKLKKADCKIGTVKKKAGATAKSGKVKRQSPKAGTILAPGTKVNVALKP